MGASPRRVAAGAMMVAEPGAMRVVACGSGAAAVLGSGGGRAMSRLGFGLLNGAVVLRP
jgi:hypothetical protein